MSVNVSAKTMLLVNTLLRRALSRSHLVLEFVNTVTYVGAPLGVVQGARTRMGREPLPRSGNAAIPPMPPHPCGTGRFWRWAALVELSKGSSLARLDRLPQHPKSPRHTSPYLRTRVLSHRLPVVLIVGVKSRNPRPGVDKNHSSLPP